VISRSAALSPCPAETSKYLTPFIFLKSEGGQGKGTECKGTEARGKRIAHREWGIGIFDPIVRREETGIP
jgi:hypothetical protein